MKVIFLDIDGVLNSREYDAKCAMTGGDLLQPDPRAVIRLIGILQRVEKATGEAPKIVLSSSWRLDKSITWPFPVYDVTPKLAEATSRADEIEKWLEVNEMDFNTEDYVILDDEADAGLLHPDRFIRTDPQTGLSADDAEVIVGLFTTSESSQ